MNSKIEIEQKHKEMVRGLKKPGDLIISQLTPEKVDLWHMATGICGEAGELIDAVKKCAVYNKELDRQNVIEELGDLEFYLEGVRNNLNITREQTLQHNYDKLGQRYKDHKYTDKQAHDRADKATS